MICDCVYDGRKVWLLNDFPACRFRITEIKFFVVVKWRKISV